jgi:plastocyanin
MNIKIVIGLIVIIVGIIIGWFVFGGRVNLNQISDRFIPPKTSTLNGKSVIEPSPTGVYTFTEELITGQPNTNQITKGGVSDNNSTKSVISYTNKGFIPKILTIKKGTSVTFSNTNTTKTMWIKSDPQKGGLTGLDELASVPNGGIYTFNFVSVGTWKYFNQVSPTDTGTIIVTQ